MLAAVAGGVAGLGAGAAALVGLSPSVSKDTAGNSDPLAAAAPSLGSLGLPTEPAMGEQVSTVASGVSVGDSLTGAVVLRVPVESRKSMCALAPLCMQ
jgi:hypothetical protein